ncbi:NAD(P)-binding domain-containing protein [Bartonella sp. W8122]|uniref:NADPH-dependent F420 reductase n=1 Tax=Bartonella sp. W8122 TaxID=2750930 RepID=UPI0018DB78B3|nr:NADPH-dependent F420 reductase [Bartonella sp. W8122]MBI0002069.1 NAD(P)-binding domain-containing protein [Bartonella sp. W8122]
MSLDRRFILKSALALSLAEIFSLSQAFSQNTENSAGKASNSSKADAVNDSPATKTEADVKNLKIGVIGAGSLGGTVATLLVKSGHSVMFSSRHPDELRRLTNPLGEKASIGTPRQAAQFGDVILVAVPFSAWPEIGKDFTTEMKGKIVIDATNPPLWGGDLEPLSIEAKKNGIAETVKYVPDVRLVRAFSAVDATVIEDCFNKRIKAVGMPIASDDEKALDIAAELVRETGCEPVMTGKLETAHIFAPGEPGFRAHLPADKLRKRLGL